MRAAAYRANIRKLVLMAVLVLLAAAVYMLIDVNPKYFSYEKVPSHRSDGCQLPL